MIIGSNGLKEGEYKKLGVVSTEQKETIIDISYDSLKQNFTDCEIKSQITRHEECFKIIADYMFEKLGQEFDKKLKFDGHWVVTVGQRLKCSSLANEKFYIEFLLGDIAFDIEYSL